MKQFAGLHINRVWLCHRIKVTYSDLDRSKSKPLMWFSDLECETIPTQTFRKYEIQMRWLIKILDGMQTQICSFLYQLSINVGCCHTEKESFLLCRTFDTITQSRNFSISIEIATKTSFRLKSTIWNGLISQLLTSEISW